MPGGIIPADHEARTWHLDAGLVPFPAVPGITGMPRVCMSVPLSILRLITPDTSLRSRPVVILFVPGFRQQSDPVPEKRPVRVAKNQPGRKHLAWPAFLTRVTIDTMPEPRENTG